MTNLFSRQPQRPFSPFEEAPRPWWQWRKPIETVSFDQNRLTSSPKAASFESLKKKKRPKVRRSELPKPLAVNLSQSSAKMASQTVAAPTPQTFAPAQHVIARRIFALFIDSLIIKFILAFVTGFVMSLFLQQSEKTGEIVVLIIPFLAILLYFAISHSSKHQATVGKRIVGLKVMDIDGGRISFIRAFIRQVLAFTLTFLRVLLLFTGFHIFLINKDKIKTALQTHDGIMNTQVRSVLPAAQVTR